MSQHQEECRPLKQPAIHQFFQKVACTPRSTVNGNNKRKTLPLRRALNSTSAHFKGPLLDQSGKRIPLPDYYPRPEVSLTTNSALSNANRMHRQGTLAEGLGWYVPNYFFVYDYEQCENKSVYYKNKYRHYIMCRCCENVHYDIRWKLDADGLCPVCAKKSVRREEYQQRVIDTRRKYLQSLRGVQINILTRKQVVEEELMVPNDDK